MPLIRVVVESTLSGPLAGFETISIEETETVQELINRFCRGKDAPVEPSYGLITKSNMILVNKQPLADFYIAEGEVLQLIIMKKSSVLVFRQWLTMSGIGMVVGVAGLIACILLYVVFRSVPDNYAMVIDGGSSATKMILYSWPGRKRNNTGEVTQVHSCLASGGIAEVAPENISAYFDPCFEESFAFIKDDSRKNAELLFGATAGMRLLNQSDSNRASQVIQSVMEYIVKSRWKFKKENIGIISGATEGVSGWITANFLEKSVLHKGSLNDTYGAMDLGGASTQITLEVDASQSEMKNVYPITLFGNKFYVFSQSYLCHGVQQALKRHRALLRLEQGEAKDPLENPCEAKGLNQTFPGDYFSQVCTQSAGIPRRDGNWSSVGTGDYAECTRTISKLLNLNECKKSNMGHCIDPSELPADVIRRKYYAFAAYAYITQDLGIPHGALIHQVEYWIQAMCQYDLAHLSIVKKKSINRKRVFESLCFEGRFMLTLLTEVYGFSTDAAWSHITFTNDVKETTLGWSLGFMVNATEEIAAGPPVPTLKVIPFSLLTLLFILFVLLSIGFILHGFKVRKNSPGYQSSKVPSQKSVISVL